MSSEYRSLLMRANRLLGAALVEHNLAKMEDLEKANERLLEVLASNQARQSTVLGILAYEMKVLKEDDVLHHIVESDGAGLIDLRNYEPNDEVRKGLDVNACWATWSVPFDKEEDFTFIATAYFLSPAVRTFWEKQYGTQIIWYGTTLDVIADYLEKLEGDKTNPAPSATRTPFNPSHNSNPPSPAAAAAVAAAKKKSA